MRNATVTALIHEFLFTTLAYQASYQSDLQLPDDEGVVRDTFCHEFAGRWEWSSAILEAVGILKRAPSPHNTGSSCSPYFHPMMTLAGCRTTDFSLYESFDNYCNAMFTLDRFVVGETIPLEDWSPQFTGSVALEDDIFRIDGVNRIVFSEDRFQEKVMTHWDTMQDRAFLPVTRPRTAGVE